jgi:putative inorganic carbon (hco3(-)) transporter
MKGTVTSAPLQAPAYLTLKKTPPIAFFFLCVYTILAFVRLHEYTSALVELPILPIALAITFFSWLAVERKDFSAPQYGIIFALLIAMTLSFMWATRWLGGTLKTFNDFLTICLFFLLISTTVNTPRRMSAFLFVLATCLFIIAIHCIDQIGTGTGWTGATLSQGTRVTYIGFLSDPNDLALTFLVVLPISVGWILRSGGWVTRKPFGVLYTVSFLYAIYLTNSRGAVVAMAIMMTVAAFLKFRSVLTLMILPVIGAILFVLAPSRVADIDSKEQSAAERIEAWYSGYLMFRSSPIFGVGQNRFQEHHTITAHNSFIQVMSELGFFGHFLWVALVAISIIMLIRAFKAQKTIIGKPPEAVNSKLFNEAMAHSNTLMFSMIGIMAASMFLSRAYVLTLYVLLALIIGNFTVMKKAFPSLETPSFRRLWSRILMIQLLGMFIMWLVTRVLL